MAVRVSINGFGRIGRLVLRSIIEHKRTDIEVVAINDLGSATTNAHLLAYDTVHGRLPGEVTVEGEWMVVNGQRIRILAERDPLNLPWKSLGIDLAM